MPGKYQVHYDMLFNCYHQNNILIEGPTHALKYICMCVCIQNTIWIINVQNWCHSVIDTHAFMPFCGVEMFAVSLAFYS